MEAVDINNLITKQEEMKLSLKKEQKDSDEFENKYSNRKSLENDDASLDSLSDLDPNDKLIEEVYPINNKEKIKNIDKKISNLKKFEVQEVKFKNKEAIKGINDLLELNGDIKGIDDKKVWTDLKDYFKKNEKKYKINEKFSISIYARYFSCFYVFVFIPRNLAIAIPAFLINFIMKNEDVQSNFGDFAKDINNFFEFIKTNKKEKFLIEFKIQREKTLDEDFDFLPQIPKLLFTEPLLVLENIIDYKVISDGWV